MGYRRTAILTISCLLVIAGCGATGRLAADRDPILFGVPTRDAVTFWGHATCYIDVAGVGIMTDPVFVNAFVLHRRRQIAAPPDSVKQGTAIVLISHAHADHFSKISLADLPDECVVLCPAPVARALEGCHKRVQVMQPGDTYVFTGGRISAVMAHHPGGRWSLKARADGRALGYVIETPDQTIYYSGDTEYFSGLWDIGRVFKPDIAILNISMHLNSHDALRAIKALGVPTVIPAHHGAYDGLLMNDPRPWREALAKDLGAKFVPLLVGQSMPLR